MREELAKITTNPYTSAHVFYGYREIEIIRREVVDLLKDPDLGNPKLLTNHLQKYRRLVEKKKLVESFLIPFVERFNNKDQQLSQFCNEITRSINWPLPSPLVSAFSTQYYWTFPSYNVICVPTTGDYSLLGLPDLCHELGHILMLHFQADLVEGFYEELDIYIKQEKRHVLTKQRPPEYNDLLNRLLIMWEKWIDEFVSDMIAVYIVGPAYGWQHIRLRTTVVNIMLTILL
jgi:hypothetical protein